MMKLLSLCTAIGVSVFFAMLTFAAPAHAAGELELSLDGVHWAQQLPGPLFAAGDKLIPGENRSAQLWVRNGAASTAELSARLTDAAWQGLIANGLATVTDSTTKGSKILMKNGSMLFTLPAGSAEEITLTVGLSTEAGNDTQLQTIPVELSFDLRESIPETATPTSTDSTSASPTATGPDGLPNTGFPLAAVTAGLLSALILIALGFGLRRAGSGRHGDGHEQAFAKTQFMATLWLGQGPRATCARHGLWAWRGWHLSCLARYQRGNVRELCGWHGRPHLAARLSLE